jgi:4-hydroxy-tetrahydrodipicolinate synthase
MALSRVITNLPIFFTNNNMINYNELGNHINTIINNGVTHLVILDTPEASTLSDVECLQFAQYVYDNFHNNVQIIVKNSELAPYANYIMLTTPTEANYTQEGLYQYFITRFNHLNLPIILSCGESLAPATIQRLSLNYNLVAIKDTSDNIPHLMHVIEVCPNLQVFTSNDNLLIPLISVGGYGVISTASNVIHIQILNLINDYFLRLTNNVQARLTQIRPIINYTSNCISLKYLLSRVRNNASISNVRYPFIQLQEEMQIQINNLNINNLLQEMQIQINNLNINNL